VNAAQMLPVPRVHSTLASRAVDLARDASLPSDEAAEHLRRLAMDRREVLQSALADLAPRRDTSPDIECACRLLLRAMSDEVGH
jgi:hypothetical protein